VREADPGLLVLGYQSRPKPIVLPAATFNQYLKEEGLDAITELRARRNQTGSDAREIFTRCAKSLVRYGMPAGAQADRALGFTLELVSDKNPYTLRAGGGDESYESHGEDNLSNRQQGPRDIATATRWDMAGQGGSHGSRARR